MNVPVEVDPVGTLEGWLPYTQPKMVSNTNWSNKTGPGAAPFGMALSGTDTTYRNPCWKAFDGDVATSFAFFSGKKSNPLTGDDNYYIDITLSDENKIRLETLEMLGGASNGTTTVKCSASLYNLDAGEPEAGTPPLAANMATIVGIAPLVLTPTVAVTANKFRIYFTNSAYPAYLASIYEVKITAKYKP